MNDEDLRKARGALDVLHKEIEKLEKSRAKPPAKGARAATKARAPKASPKVTQSFKQLGVHLDALGLFAAAESSDKEATFEEFFQEIGEGLVKAQAKMDDASRQYMAGVSGLRFIQPSIFRIPRVTAQMKFALEKSKGFHLFFSKDDTQSQQQSVEFEVVSAPPPAAAELAPFLYEPILAPVRRTALAASIKKASGPADLLNNFDRVLILATEAGVRYLILFADAQSKCGIWFLFDDPKTPSLLALRTLSAGTEATGKVIFDQGNRQAEFLKQLR